MRYPLVLVPLLLIAGFYNGADSSDELDSIAQFQWQNRILLVRAQQSLEQLLYALNKADPDIQDRTIYWFVLAKGDIYTNYTGAVSARVYIQILQKYFSKNKANVVLIGKDGHVKNRNEVLSLTDIFELIDGMPMRQLEMQK